MFDYEAGIDVLYASLDDQEQFGDALRAFLGPLRTHAFHALVVDPVTFEPISGLCPVAPEAHDEYLTKYAPIDPRITLFGGRDSPRAFDLNAPFKQESHANSPVFHEFLGQFDAQKGTSVVKHLGPSMKLIFSAFRPDHFDEYDQQEVANFENIARNLTRILHFKGIYGVGIGAEPGCVVYLSSFKRVLDLSEEAERELSISGGELDISLNKLIAREPKSDKQLQDAIDAVISDGTSLSKDVVIRNRFDDAKYIATVQSNQSDAVLDVLQCSPKATVRFRRVDRKLKISEELVRDFFELTPTEAAITCRLCEGASVQNIALERNVAVSTVRWTIRNLLEKLEVSSQTELVATVCRVPGMLK